MESYWLQSLESSLRKEPHPDVKRTVHIIPPNETWDEFMSRHLVELENNGVGKFSSVKRRGADQIQWRCEKANKCKGRSSRDPTTTRAKSCGAYVSFTFVSKNTFNTCIVRLMNKHSGHDFNNSRTRGLLRSRHTPRTNFAQIHPQLLITTNLTATSTATNATIATSNNNTATTTSTTVTTSHTVLTHSTLSTQHTPPPINPSSSSTQHTPIPIKPCSFSTQHAPKATPATSTPKIFKEIWSILPLSSGGKKKRCKITVEELERRVGPPEYMSFSSLAAYLRTDNNTRRELQAQLEEAGIKPTQFTAEMSLFSRLCEGKLSFFSLHNFHESLR
ncbi:uncharacterized protein LOC130119793 [Lampris incognitus]|uniref:uncharacterized protein LOC130119793 n=1 Tax=Lampris incognitus TaxID=2546036 RepID=UPI0024B4E6B5|nr:uncharacterized protein LOC130119793 [Lampris incognitus]